MKGENTAPAAHQPRSGAGAAAETVDSRRLLGGQGKLIIRHHGEAYTLRVTVNGRLILTK